MKTVGEILAEERRKQGRTLEEISQQTKIPIQTLENIEKNRLKALPPATFVKGFIRNYAQELALDADKILAIFRRDNHFEDKNKILPQGITKPLDNGFSWTPRATAILFSTLVLTIIIGFLFFQVRGYLFAPPLDIKTPKNGELINNLSVEIVGKTIPDATVYIDDQLANLEFNGNFTYNLKLLPGENLIEVKAVNRRGQETKLKRTVVVDKKQ